MNHALRNFQNYLLSQKVGFLLTPRTMHELQLNLSRQIRSNSAACGGSMDKDFSPCCPTFAWTGVSTQSGVAWKKKDRCLLANPHVPCGKLVIRYIPIPRQLQMLCQLQEGFSTFALLQHVDQAWKRGWVDPSSWDVEASDHPDASDASDTNWRLNCLLRPDSCWVPGEAFWDGWQRWLV